MIKFEKRVALNKISRFFKNTPLVIFFHCIDQKDFYEKLTRSLILKKSNILSAKIKKQGHLSIAEVKDAIAKEGLMIKSVKNNYAKKAFSNNKAFSENPFASLPPIPPHHLINPIEKVTKKGQGEQNIEKTELNIRENHLIYLRARKDTLEPNKARNPQDNIPKSEGFPKNQISDHSLFQGNHILIGFKEVNSLALIKDFIEDKNIDVFGAIYENNCIDHNQVKRLASIVQKQDVYANLLYLLESFKCRIPNQLSRHLDFSYLLHPHAKMIALLQTLHSHKSSPTK